MGSRASWGSPRVGVQGVQLSSGAGGRAGTGGQGLREMFGGGEFSPVLRSQGGFRVATGSWDRPGALAVREMAGGGRELAWA